MFRFIDKLRKQPEKKRQGIVLAASLSITFVIAVFWIIALVIKIQNGALSFKVSNGDNGQIQRSAAALQSSWDSFMHSVNNIGNALGSSSAPAAPAALVPVAPDASSSDASAPPVDAAASPDSTQ